VTSGVIPGSPQDFARTAGERVFFDLDSHELRADALSTLDAQAAWLARYPNVQVRIEGNADERGTREYNVALGARRASAVREYLSTKGLSPARMSTISYGKERPIDPGTTEEAHQRNRNAATVIVGGAN
jgi:peptidoglycan-associated lipoprotein